MPGLYNLADIVIMASEAEGLARAYIEAMASECLLLVSDIPAARELVVDGKNGMFFPVGDTEKIAQKTLLAAGDHLLRTRIGGEARKSVQNRSLDQAVRHYLREIESVLNTGNTKRRFAEEERQG
jgi:glycosyltransferase involved in cell wall biosynthesis